MIYRAEVTVVIYRAEVTSDLSAEVNVVIYDRAGLTSDLSY